MAWNPFISSSLIAVTQNPPNLAALIQGESSYLDGYTLHVQAVASPVSANEYPADYAVIDCYNGDATYVLSNGGVAVNG